ncbi:hypothetical protein VFPFJ_06308 [Purpureocillium lilacinum]|uniref:Uncharacterized protein n=1 Tax=Purpureocillium lilacinum TaxID=33203 RepID=A0A179HIN3_PURLI|nr:hypothetical protein VFPFJ_06308 [Purpureocillium lilacinum]OAQ89894.1 hypothetical protein VFPFJ_06308 [Purpureocillium lilacinum]
MPARTRSLRSSLQPPCSPPSPDPARRPSVPLRAEGEGARRLTETVRRRRLSRPPNGPWLMVQWSARVANLRTDEPSHESRPQSPGQGVLDLRRQRQESFTATDTVATRMEPAVETVKGRQPIIPSFRLPEAQSCADDTTANQTLAATRPGLTHRRRLPEVQSSTVLYCIVQYRTPCARVQSLAQPARSRGRSRLDQQPHRCLPEDAAHCDPALGSPAGRGQRNARRKRQKLPSRGRACVLMCNVRAFLANEPIAIKGALRLSFWEPLPKRQVRSGQ